MKKVARGKKYDVIVIGGGPSGATAAYLLAKQGLKVVVLEKKAFPRQKVCAGLLTWKTLNLLNELYGLSINDLTIKGVVNYSCRDYRIFFRNVEIADGRLDFPFYFVDRPTYDQFCLQRAREAGARIETGNAAITIDVDTLDVMTANGLSFNAGIIIGADGVWSRVRKAMALDRTEKKKWRNCLASTIETLHLKQPKHCGPSYASLHFGYVSWGYAWRFPGRDYQTLGIGALRNRNRISLKAAFKAFVSTNTDIAYESNTLISHPLPYGNFSTRPAKGRLMLVGDACGLADPLLGEGIFYAHRSAQLASKAVIDKLPGFIGLAEYYRALLDTNLRKELYWIRFYRNLLFMGGHRRRFRGLRLFLKLFPKMLEAAVQGKCSYSQIIRPGGRPA